MSRALGLPLTDPKTSALVEGASSIPQEAASGVRDNLPLSPWRRIALKEASCG